MESETLSCERSFDFTKEEDDDCSSDSDYDPTETKTVTSALSTNKPSDTNVSIGMLAGETRSSLITKEKNMACNNTQLSTALITSSMTSTLCKQNSHVLENHLATHIVINTNNSYKNNNNDSDNINNYTDHELALSPSSRTWFRLHAAKTPIRCIAVNPSGTILCASSSDGHLCMYDFTTSLTSRHISPTRVLTPFVNRIAGLQGITSLHASLDNSYFVVCQDGDSPLVLQHTGKSLGFCAMGERGLMDVIRCKGHRAAVTASAPHACNAALFYTSSADGTARLWDVNKFEIGSSYVVKHGSGQLDDNVVVECVTGLGHFNSTIINNGNKSYNNASNQFTGSVFATSGEDGCVQVWDHRVKYRPNGSIMKIDVYKELSKLADGTKREGKYNLSMIANTHLNEFTEKHIGGLTELCTASGTSQLAIRANEHVIAIDLRKASLLYRNNNNNNTNKASSSATNTQTFITSLPHKLPCSLECISTPLINCCKENYLCNNQSNNNNNNNFHSVKQTYNCYNNKFLACTSCAGYNGVKGGHVITIGATQTNNNYNQQLITHSAWQAGKLDEDVLCACMDTSRIDGCIFAGLSSGDVVVSIDANCLHHDYKINMYNNTEEHPIIKWLHSRPKDENVDKRKTGYKHAREMNDSDEKSKLNKTENRYDFNFTDNLF